MTEIVTEQRVAGYRIHPAANLFPLMSKPELRELAGDMEMNGQCEPIVCIYTGGKRSRPSVYDVPNPDEALVVDGRNRLLACEMAGLVPWLIYGVTGDHVDACGIDARGAEADPVGYVVSANLHRRHLTAEQRAAVVIRAAELSGELAKLQAEAKVRDPEARASREARPGKTAARLAEQAKVSTATVERVQAATKGDPEALGAIARGATTSAKVRVRRSPRVPVGDKIAGLLDKIQFNVELLDESLGEAGAVQPEWMKSMRTLRRRLLAVIDKHRTRGPARVGVPE